MPPIWKMIGQPCVGTKVAATKPGMAPPSGTQPTAMMASVARRWRGADSALIATTLGMTPPMPSPASKRSTNICCRSLANAAASVKTPNRRFDPTSAALRP